MKRPVVIAFGYLASLLLVLPTFTAAAPKKKPAQPSHFFPAGAQRGTTVTVEIAGDVPDWPMQVWVDRPGIQITAEEAKGKLKVVVEETAPLGTCWLRLYTDGGASSLRPFIIGTLPEVAEVEPNDAPDKPQVVEPKVVINGKLAKSGDVDGYQVKLQAGQTLVAAVQANNILGSPMDGILQICRLVQRPVSKFEPAETEAIPLEMNHDANGLDPLLAFTAPTAGDYLVRVFAQPAIPDSSIRFSGAETFVYRLTLTTGPYLDHALPLVVAPAGGEVQIAGWNLPAMLPTVKIPAANGEESETEVSLAELAGTFSLPRSEAPSILAIEQSEPQAISLPAVISGRFELGDESDLFRFSAKKGEELHCEVETRAFGSAAIPQLAIRDESGKILLEKDGLTGMALRDFSTSFKVPADGVYLAELRQVAAGGGLRHAYRMTLTAAEPDFVLSLAAGNFVQADEQPLEIVVTVERRNKFNEPIEIVAEGLPAGLTAESVTSAPMGDSAKTVKLNLKRLPEFAATFQGPIRIVGKTAVGKRTRIATFANPLPRTSPQTAVWLTAVK